MNDKFKEVIDGEDVTKSEVSNTNETTNTTETTNTAETTTSDDNEYEDICYICRRPSSVAGRMIKIQDGLCICNDCMQKTFDSMNSGNFGMGNLFGGDMNNMPNIKMVNLADLQGGIPNSQKLKKKKPKEKKAEPVLDIHSIPAPPHHLFAAQVPMDSV